MGKNRNEKGGVVMKEFSCRTKLVMGQGAVEALQNWNFQRLMIISDPFFVKNGWAERIGRYSKCHEIFDQVVPDPSVELVAKGTGAVQAFRPDGMVALGGGSAMDCAKAMCYFSGLDIPLIAIPTTSGSGSEVTDFAVLTHNGIKYPLVDEKLKPRMAILEEDLLTSMPVSLIADSGFDVIAHALEAWVGKNSNPMTDALAFDSFRIACNQLPLSAEGDLSARMAVHCAASMAGLAFTHAGLGLCHALSHSLGGLLHLPHGRLNAILLPAVITCNGEFAGAKYACLSRLMGLGGGSDMMAIRNLKNALIRLRGQLNLPANLEQAGVHWDQWRGKTPQIIASALADPCCSTNPGAVTEEMVHLVLKEIAGRG